MVKEIRISLDDSDHKLINKAKKKVSYKKWMVQKAKEDLNK